MGSKKIDSQVRILLTDTILALCKNTLNQYGEVAVEGLLGITLDKEEIFLVSLHETIRNKNRVSKLSEGSSRKHKQSEGSGASDGDSDSEGSRRKKRRKKNKRSRSTDSVSDGASKGSKSDGESYLRKSPHNSSSSQAVVKQEVIDDDDILITKENIRGKHDGHFSSYNQAGGDHLDLQMSQYQTGALSMSSNMASTGAPPVLFPVRRRDVMMGRTCPFCQKVFAAPSNLRDHVRTHTGERPYRCAICGRAFTQKFHMQRHMARLHNIPMPKPTYTNSHNSAQNNTPGYNCSSASDNADGSLSNILDQEKYENSQMQQNFSGDNRSRSEVHPDGIRSSPDHHKFSSSDHADRVDADSITTSLPLQFYSQHFLAFADNSNSDNCGDPNNSDEEEEDDE